MTFVANFQQCKNFENRLRFDKVRDSLKVGPFLRHSVVSIFTVLESIQSFPWAVRSVQKGTYPNFQQRPMSDTAY